MTGFPVAIRRRALAWAVIFAGFAGFSVACAVRMAPPGGPEDKTPPSVAETVPARDSAGVAADSRIRITFSENMTRRGLERNLEFSPPVVIEKLGWDGRTAVVSVKGGLHPDTTYIVSLKAGVQDNHRVASKKEFRFAFATSASIDSGRVEGRVRFRREPSAHGVVHCYVLRDTAFVPGATRPERTVRADEMGAFSLDYLATDQQRYVVWAFEDVNKDGSFTPDQDVGFAGLDTVTLTASAPVEDGIVIAIVDPDEPATVRGRIVNESGIDTVRVSVALFAEPDTLSDPAPAYYVVCDTTGGYQIATVRAGTYRLRAFVDMFADSLCGEYPCGPDSSAMCVEPCVLHADSVVVQPGDVRTMNPIELGAVAGRGGK